MVVVKKKNAGEGVEKEEVLFRVDRNANLYNPWKISTEIQTTISHTYIPYLVL